MEVHNYTCYCKSLGSMIFFLCCVVYNKEYAVSGPVGPCVIAVYNPLPYVLYTSVVVNGLLEIKSFIVHVDIA